MAGTACDVFTGPGVRPNCLRPFCTPALCQGAGDVLAEFATQAGPPLDQQEGTPQGGSGAAGGPRAGPGSVTFERYAPCLLPEQGQVAEVRVKGPRYWQQQLVPGGRGGRSGRQGPSLAALYATRTLFVQRKAGALPYADDPSGGRAVRGGCKAGSDASPHLPLSCLALCETRRLRRCSKHCMPRPRGPSRPPAQRRRALGAEPHGAPPGRRRRLAWRAPGPGAPVLHLWVRPLRHGLCAGGRGARGMPAGLRPCGQGCQGPPAVWPGQPPAAARPSRSQCHSPRPCSCSAPAGTKTADFTRACPWQRPASATFAGRAVHASCPLSPGATADPSRCRWRSQGWSLCAGPSRRALSPPPPCTPPPHTHIHTHRPHHPPPPPSCLAGALCTSVSRARSPLRCPHTCCCSASSRWGWVRAWRASCTPRQRGSRNGSGRRTSSHAGASFVPGGASLSVHREYCLHAPLPPRPCRPWRRNAALGRQR